MTPEALAELHARAFTTRPRPWNAAEFASLLATPGTIAIVRPEGFALGWAAADETELLTLAVHPDARRRGIGGALLAAFEAAAWEAGARTMFLEVAETNAAALALYARAGLVAVGRRPGYYPSPGGEGADALILRKPLTQDPAGEK